MKKFFAVAFFLFFAVSFSLADAGPGPVPVELSVDLVKGGKPFAGEVEMFYLCSNATTRGLDSGVKPGDLQLNCTGGKCFSDYWYYKFNPCFYSKGRLEAKVGGKTLTSEEISLEAGGSYSFTFDVESGEAKQTNYSPSCLPIGLIVLLFAASFAFAARVGR